MRRSTYYWMSLLTISTLMIVVLSLSFRVQVTRASHTPNPASVTVAGSLQSELGCPADWQPECANTHLTFDADDDVWQGIFNVPAGNWAYKAALNDNWSENYGLGGARDGANIPLNLASPQSVKFYYDHKSHWITSNKNSVIAVAPGSFQSELGCGGDWDPSCLRSWFQDADGDGIYTFETTALPAGNYESKVAINESWDENYGQGGVPNGSNIPFNVPANNAPVTFSYDSRTHVLSISAATGDIQWEGLRHDTFDSYYRSPFGAVAAGTSVTLRFRTAHFDVDGVSVRVYTYDPATDSTAAPVDYPMTFLENRTENGILYDIWTTTLTTPSAPKILYYKFRITDAGDVDFYSDSYADDNDNLNQGGEGAAYDNEPFPAFQITVYDPSFQTPTWLRNANVYHIFPDRFRNGDPTNDYCVAGSTSGCPTFYGDQIPLPRSPWNVAIGDPRQPGVFQNQYGTQFYGGDLAGIRAKLDYLQSLGIDTLYLNPIFKARSNHRYDTDDYLEVDPALGGNAALAALVDETKKRGMRLIFDGVFNHSSSDSRYFDRYHRYSPPDAGCESVGSVYRSWYSFFGSGPCDGQSYESWFGFDSLPLFQDGNPDVRFFFYRDTSDSVTKHWFDRGAAGWRFDVANDISHNWWHDYRTFAKSYKSDGPLIGEIWPDASQYLAGDQLDSVMNYRFRKNVLGFARGLNWTDNDNNGNNTIVGLAPSQFDHALRSVREDYPAQATAAMLNLLDSHDTNRALYVLTLGGDSGLVEAKERLKLSALFQFTYPGAPMVYYGDEGALNSPALANGPNGPEDDPYNRAPYPWSDEAGDQTVYGPIDNSVLSFYTTLAHLRKQFTALREGSFETLLTGDTTAAGSDNNTYAFARVAGAEKAIVVLNNGSATNTASIPVASYFADGTMLQDALSGATFTVSGGFVNITLAARNGAVLLPFPAVVDLTAPMASIGVNPAANGNGWWQTSPTITLSANDSGSGVKELRYWINGGNVIVVSGSSTSFVINTEGITTINLRAVDNAGNISSLATKVIRLDRTAPQISLTTNTLLLSPPNHKYHTFAIADLVFAASDAADTSVDINDVVISSATSDEPDEARGNGDGNKQNDKQEDARGNNDGNLPNDIVIAVNCKSVMLRSERAGDGDGRLYKITLKVKDAAGNVGTAVRQVFVPLTKGRPVIDSGVKYTVNGCSP